MESVSLPVPFVERLVQDFPADFWSREPADLAEYGRDWTREVAPNPGGVAFPRTTGEVSRLLALCSAHDVAVVPSGGRTGLSGGAVAASGELVVSMGRMRRMDPVDLQGSTVRVQAGAVTEAVHRHCAPHGLTWPVDFASKGSSHVGGNIATNAGGVKVIRYGLTRTWVLGLEVVLASGEVLSINGALEKNNTGLDLRQLFIGSEGTLGIVTEATLKLTRVPDKLDVFMFALPDFAAVLRLLDETRRGPFTIMAYEFLTQHCVELVRAHRKLRAPFAAQAPYYVLVETEGSTPAALDSWFASLLERELVIDGVIAQNATHAAELWSLREGIGEAVAAGGVAHHNDVALPVAALEGFCAELPALVSASYPTPSVAVFGHVGDGNIHLSMAKPAQLSEPEFLRLLKIADAALFELVAKYKGSISAEHGIGLLKPSYLPLSRSPGEIALMRTIKQALDPKGILNPGKVLG